MAITFPPFSSSGEREAEHYTPAGAILTGLAGALVAFLQARDRRQQNQLASQKLSMEAADKERAGRREDLRAEAYAEYMRALGSQATFNQGQAQQELQNKVAELEQARDALEQLNQIRGATDQYEQARLRFRMEQLQGEVTALEDVLEGGGGGGSMGAARGGGSTRRGGGSTRSGSNPVLDDLSSAIADLLAASATSEAQGDNEVATSYRNNAERLLAMLPYAGGGVGLQEWKRAGMEQEGYPPYMIDFVMRKNAGMLDATESESIAKMLESEGSPYGFNVAALLRADLPRPSSQTAAPNTPRKPSAAERTMAPAAKAIGKGVGEVFNPENYLKGVETLAKGTGFIRTYQTKKPAKP